jgi:hypothetical protein
MALKRIAGAAVLLLAFGGVAYAIGAGLIDDSYIFLRYARHVVQGVGPVFNVGERVEGYTSPLWLASLVPLFTLSAEPSTLAMCLSALLGFGCVLLVWRRSVWNALLLATQPAFVFWSWSGMETALAAILLRGAFVALDHGERPQWLGLRSPIWSPSRQRVLAISTDQRACRTARCSKRSGARTDRADS